MNRSYIMEQFGVLVNQAWTDLNRYMSFAPDKLIYDKSPQTYVRSLEYYRQFLKLDTSRNLTQRYRPSQ